MVRRPAPLQHLGLASVQFAVKPFFTSTISAVANNQPNENRKHEDREQEEPNGCSPSNCNCLGGLVSDDRWRAVRLPHQPAKNMSDETRMESIVPADRAWVVFANAETGYSQKERVVCWSRLTNGDVVGLVMRKNGLVRADSQAGFVSYLDEVKPTEITPTRFEDPTTDESCPP
jgi:hypothetical protein